MNGIREEGANSFDKNLFNIWFYLTNLCQLKIINKKEIVQADRVDRADRSRVDRKKVDRSSTVAENLVAENLTPENSEIASENIIPENLGIIP